MLCDALSVRTKPSRMQRESIVRPFDPQTLRAKAYPERVNDSRAIPLKGGHARKWRRIRPRRHYPPWPNVLLPLVFRDGIEQRFRRPCAASPSEPRSDHRDDPPSPRSSSRPRADSPGKRACRTGRTSPPRRGAACPSDTSPFGQKHTAAFAGLLVPAPRCTSSSLTPAVAASRPYSADAPLFAGGCFVRADQRQPDPLPRLATQLTHAKDEV